MDSVYIGNWKRRVTPGMVVFVLVGGFVLLLIGIRVHDKQTTELELEIAEEYKAIAIEIVEKGMTPREAIAYARTHSDNIESLAISASDRNPNAFGNDALPEAFDRVDWINYGRDLPRPYRLYSKPVFCTIDFKDGHAFRWTIVGEEIDLHRPGYSGRRKGAED